MSRFRQYEEHLHAFSAFGGDEFGRKAESFARFFGTSRFLIGQTVVVAVWIVVNALLGASRAFDYYPFILLNLAFSLQAAYAAPLILLAQTRQADRDKMAAEIDARHREQLATAAEQQAAEELEQIDLLKRLLDENTRLTQQIDDLTREIHMKVLPG